MLNFVLCDDNQNAVNKLSKLLNAIIIQNRLDGQLVFSSNEPSNLLDYVKSHPVNVVILDIDFKDDTSGLQLAEHIRKLDKNIYIIFITGHLEYGLMAYKYKTFDYIPKPVTMERLECTILRLFDDAYEDSPKYIRLDNNKTIIPENSIRYIEKDGMKLVFNTDTRTYKVYNSLNKVKNILPKQFVRCHKSYIVNLDKIYNVDTLNNVIIFDNNEKCYIGPKYKNYFMEVLKNGNYADDMVVDYDTQ